MKHSKTLCTKIHSTVDVQSGEIISEQVTLTTNIGTEPNYVKLYLEDILLLNSLSTGLTSVLNCMLKRIDYDNNIFLNISIKRMICKETNLSMNTVNKAITHFVKRNILVRKDVGLYIANPYLFGKGKWSDIQKIRLQINYNNNGKSISTEVTHKDIASV